MEVSGVVLWMGAGGDGEIYARLADLLRAEYGLETLPRMERDERGKPRFPDRPALHFNVSHSGGLLLCGAGGVPLGVDVERVRPRRAGLARYVLDEGEFQWYQDRGSRWDVLYSLWTLKEARCKCTGEGLRRPPKDIAVPLLEAGEAGELEGLYFRAYGGDGWRAAVCSAGERPPRLADMPENI